ncbi:hypothetical protein IEQ34_010611 [Dendrobium chrysotoxum]|uniref:Uncharacterized protein n=1 Tax=Dendrobium chrysotoxum TaxID=161865 RepID=A0AAV7GWB6_DENCH|nr:hypothetical protein IEQ34_010611 [Dendrobium chrysotoxum]
MKGFSHCGSLEVDRELHPSKLRRRREHPESNDDDKESYLLMGDTNKRVDIEKLFSLANDLIGMLNDGKDGDSLMQSLESAKSLRSFCETNVHETNMSLEEFQKRINGCKERIDKVKGEVMADSKLNELQTELEEKMHIEHLLLVGDELDYLEQQRISFEERWQLVKQRENNMLKSQNALSMCASVTRIIPDHTNKTKISGSIVDRSKKKVEKFEFDPTMPPFEVCDELWKMSS